MRQLGLINSFPRLKVAVVGDLMEDLYTVGEVRRVSPEGPHLVFRDLRSSRSIMGGAGNVWMNITTLGAKCDMYSIYRASERLKLPPGTMFSGPGYPPIIKQRLIDPEGQVIIRVDHEEVASDWQGPVPPEWAELINDGDYDAIIFADYNKGTLRGITPADFPGIPVFVDCHPSVDKSSYSGAYVLKPNKSELRAIWGDDDAAIERAIEQCRCIDGMSPGGVVVTRDSDSVIVASMDGDRTSIKPNPVSVHDVTGAGDTFISALALSSCSGASLKEAAEIATMAAELAVSFHGTYAVSASELVHRAVSKSHGKVITEETYRAISAHFVPKKVIDYSSVGEIPKKNGETIFVKVKGGREELIAVLGKIDEIDFVVICEETED